MNREELEKDRENIIAQLQQLQGALAYVNQKLSALEKLEKSNGQEAKKPEKAEA